jgi:Protein of unknown function (DUF4232)
VNVPFVTGTVASLAVTAGQVIPWLPLPPPKEPLRPLAPPCRASHLAAKLDLNGATGSLVLFVTLRNVGPASCSLRGRPAVALEGKNAAAAHWVTKPMATAFAEPASVRARLRALHPGETAIVSIWWSNWCGPGSQPASGPGPPPDDLLLTLPVSGDPVRLATSNAPRCDDPTAPSILAVQPFAFRQRQPRPASKLPLAATILGQTDGRLSNKPGPVIRARRDTLIAYVVALTNTSRRPFRFRSCPTYVEQFVPRGTRQTYVLNCHPLGTLASHATARFAMVIRIPADAPRAGGAVAWELGPNTYLPPFAAAKLILDG